jgi:hypothetical protein
MPVGMVTGTPAGTAMATLAATGTVRQPIRAMAMLPGTAMATETTPRRRLHLRRRHRATLDRCQIPTTAMATPMAGKTQTDR